MSLPDFNLNALYVAIDEHRRSRDLSWATVAREVNSQFKDVRQHRRMATSTITSLRTKRIAEGDGILQLLVWLGRSPESFVAGSDTTGTSLPVLKPSQILRWDTNAIYLAVDHQRQIRGMSWMNVAEEIGGVTANTLTHLAAGGRTSFPFVMRIIAWLRRPAMTYTRASDC